MPTAHLTRVVAFSAAHRYYRPAWSAARNAEVFGPCANEHGHGHRYECHVTVSGPVDSQTGMVIDLAMLDRLLRDEILDRFDHRHINHDVPEFAFGALVPTTETLAGFIWEKLAGRLPAGIRLERVRLYEDPQLYAEYRAEASAGPGALPSTADD